MFNGLRNMCSALQSQNYCFLFKTKITKVILYTDNTYAHIYKCSLSSSISILSPFLLVVFVVMVHQLTECINARSSRAAFGHRCSLCSSRSTPGGSGSACRNSGEAVILWFGCSASSQVAQIRSIPWAKIAVTA